MRAQSFCDDLASDWPRKIFEAWRDASVYD
jgi:hypothetical protein